MDVEVTQKTDEKMGMVIEGISPSFANAFRRSLMDHVPVLAIDETDIYKNDSALYNEMLAHRLAMVPLRFDPEALNLQEECSCEGEGCVQCEVVFTLEAEGPTTIYTEDLESQNEDVETHYDNIPLVYLEEGQEVDIEAVARLGRGKDHAKWQAAVAGYRYYPEIEVGDVSADEAEEIAENCPNTFKRAGRGIKLVEDNLHQITDSCIESLPESVEVDHNENKFIFQIDTATGLGPGQVASLALEVLESKADAFEDDLSQYA